MGRRDQSVLDHEKWIDVLIMRPDRGFTLVELLVTIAVIAILAALSVPSFSTMIGNAKVRSVTEGLQNGLRLAQGEAIRRSRQTAFVLTNATPALSATPAINGTNWYAQMLPITASEAVDATFYVQGGAFGNQTSGVTITGPAVICFNSVGRVVTNSATGLGVACAAPTPMVVFDVTRTGADRTLALQVSAAGKIRMCDRSRTLSATQPDGC